MNDLHKAIEDIRNRITAFDGRASRVNEADTIRVLITPMIEALGWNTLDLDEVQSEYRHKPGDDPVDYALFVDGVPVLFVEAKALDKNLNDRKWIVQTLNYANACNVPWTILTNGEEWRVYKVHVQREAEEKLFYSSKLTEQTSDEVAKRLVMLAKESMAPKPALDKLWREAEVDMKMRGVIEGLSQNKSAVRAMAKASNGLSEKDVREALLRIKLRADWRDDEDMFPLSSTHQNNLDEDIQVSEAQPPVSPVVAVPDSAPVKPQKVRTVTGPFSGEWPEGATHVMFGKGYCAFGHFDVEAQKIKILPGSVIVKDYKEDQYLNSSTKTWKKESIRGGTLVDAGGNTLRLLVETEYYAPSPAAGIVACGARDGWTYWKDRQGNTLHSLRRANPVV